MENFKGPMRGPALWTQMQFMKANGSERIEMALVNRYGLMARDTRVIGKTIKQMAKANFSMQTVTFMKGAGLTIKQMVSVLILMLMEPGTLANGEMINRTVMAMKHGQTVLFTKASIKTARSMGWAGSLSQIKVSTKANSL